MKILAVLFLFFIINTAQAQTDCPFGLTNDPAPGACARYVDADDNALCDLSEVPLEKDFGLSDKSQVPYISEEKLKSMSVKEVAEAYGIETSAYRSALSEFLKIDVKGGESLLDLHDNNGLCSGVAANIALGIKNKQTQGLETGIAKDVASGLASADAAAIKKPVLSARYKFLPIFAVTATLYGLTLFLAKRKKISFLTHKRIWNIFLLVSFLLSAILAMFLIIRINWGWHPSLPFSMLYWHVETGTVMLVISLFHIFEHRRFYTCIFAAKKKGECD